MRTQRSSASFVRHSACPECGSRDNRAIYDDGSTWCFGCLTYSPPSHYTPPEEEMEEPKLEYPRKLSDKLAEGNDKWLSSYGLNEAEKALFKMDNETGRHVILCHDKGNLVYYEARSVTPVKPKCLSKGTKPIRFIDNTGGICPTVCLTEDIVSAILVGRHVVGGCLFGSHLSDLQQVQLRRFSNVIVWLDYDKTNVAFQIVDKLDVMGYNVNMITEDQGDPKDLSEEHRASLLGQALEFFSTRRS